MCVLASSSLVGWGCELQDSTGLGGGRGEGGMRSRTQDRFPFSRNKRKSAAQPSLGLTRDPTPRGRCRPEVLSAPLVVFCWPCQIQAQAPWATERGQRWRTEPGGLCPRAAAVRNPLSRISWAEQCMPGLSQMKKQSDNASHYFAVLDTIGYPPCKVTCELSRVVLFGEMSAQQAAHAVHKKGRKACQELKNGPRRLSQKGL